MACRAHSCQGREPCPQAGLPAHLVGHNDAHSAIGGVGAIGEVDGDLGGWVVEKQSGMWGRTWQEQLCWSCRRGRWRSGVVGRDVMQWSGMCGGNVERA